MKILHFLFVTLLIFSALPLEALCADHEDAADHHHGVLVCHSMCHSAVQVQKGEPFRPPVSNAPVVLSETLAYENPLIPSEGRPPKVFS